MSASRSRARTSRGDGPASRAGSRLDRWCAATLAAIPVALFGRALLPGRMLSPAGVILQGDPWRYLPRPGVEFNASLADVASVFQPWLAYAAAAVRDGRLPLWNPHAFCGAPFLANMQSALFSPFTLPAYVLPLGVATGLAAILKLETAGLGMYAFLRRLGLDPIPAVLGGATFMLNGWLIVWLQFPLSSAAVWLPWLLLVTDRLAVSPGPLNTVWLAILTAASHVGGHPETTLHVLVATGAFAVYRAWGNPRGMAWCAGGLALGTVLAAVQLVPFFEYLRESSVWAYRREGIGALSHAWRTFPLQWVPLVEGYVGNFHEASGSVGFVPWLLVPAAILGRRRCHATAYLAGLAVVSAAVAYEAPVLSDLLAVIPGFNVSANHRALLLLAFSTAALGAAGLHALLAPGRGPGTAGVVAGAVAAAALGVLLVGWRWNDDRAVAYVAFTPEGGRLAVAHMDGTVRMVDPDIPAEVGRLSGHRDSVLAVAAGASGGLLASASLDGSAKLWSLKERRAVRTLAGHRGMVWTVAISPDGRLTATGGRDGIVRVWDSATGEEIRRLKGHRGEVIASTFLGNGGRLATAGEDGIVRVWDAGTGEPVLELAGHAGPVTAVSSGAGGRRLASAGSDGTVRLWDPAAGVQLAAFPFPGGVAYSASLDSSASILAAGGRDGTVTVWELGTSGEGSRLRGLADDVWCVAVSADGTRVAAGDRGGRIAVWRSGTERPAAVLALSPDLPRSRSVTRVIGFTVAGLLAAAVLVTAARYRPVPAGAALAALATASLVPLAAGYHHTLDRRHFFPVTRALAFLAEHAGRERTILPVPNAGCMYGLLSPGGYDAMTPRRMEGLLKGGFSQGRYGNAPLEFVEWPDSPATDVAAVRYVLPSFRRAPPNGRFAVAYDGVDGRVLENLGASPRTYAVGEALWVPTDDAALRAVLHRAVEFDRTVVLTGPPPLINGGGAPGRLEGRIAVEEDDPERQAFTLDFPRAGYLVMSDLYFPGWEADLDGERVPILRANYAFRAVRVPAGRHSLVMVYRPASFRLGLAASAFAGLTVAILLLRGASRRPGRRR